MTTFRIVNPDHPFSRCLDDLAACLADGLRRIGCTVEQAKTFRGHAGEIEIALGCHSRHVEMPGHAVIIYQTELPTSKFWTQAYVDRLNRALAVWDAVPGLRYDLVPNVKRAVIEPGDMQHFDVMTHGEKDIDLLFYGSLSPRRIKILTKLQDAGLNPEVHFNVYGAERDRLIDRSKVVLDIKQGEGDPDDITRTFYLDSRGACVLSENDPSCLARERLNPGEVVQQCRDLLADHNYRAVHANSRRHVLRSRELARTVLLRAAVSEFERTPASIGEAFQAAALQ